MNLRKEYEDLKSKMAMIMEESEKQENEPKDFELYLRKSNIPNMLEIGFNFNGCFERLGFINYNGECNFINTDDMRKNWEIWKENGFKVAEQEPVEWQGLEWIIDKNWKLRIFGKFLNCVYDFSEKRAYDGLEADNDFLKKDSDNRIHLY